MGEKIEGCNAHQKEWMFPANVLSLMPYHYMMRHIVVQLIHSFIHSPKPNERHSDHLDGLDGGHSLCMG